MDHDESKQNSHDVSPLLEAREPFEAFFRREYRSVLGLAIVLCGRRAVAEELTMDAFEAALRRWDRVAALDDPGAWVRKVVSNASVSRFRRLAAETKARLRMSGEVAAPSADVGEHADLWQAVRRLPRRQAQVIALFYVEGYHRREIADLLEISDESVKTHLERARRRLGKDLGDADAY